MMHFITLYQIKNVISEEEALKIVKNISTTELTRPSPFSNFAKTDMLSHVVFLSALIKYFSPLPSFGLVSAAVGRTSKLLKSTNVKIGFL